MIRTKKIWVRPHGLMYKVLPEIRRWHWYTKAHELVFPAGKRYEFYGRYCRRNFEPRFRRDSWIKMKSSIWTKEK